MGSGHAQHGTQVVEWELAFGRKRRMPLADTGSSCLVSRVCRHGRGVYLYARQQQGDPRWREEDGRGERRCADVGVGWQHKLPKPTSQSTMTLVGELRPAVEAAAQESWDRIIGQPGTWLTGKEKVGLG